MPERKKTPCRLGQIGGLSPPATKSMPAHKLATFLY